MGSRSDADLDVVELVRYDFPPVSRGRSRPALVDVAQLDGLADLHDAAVGLFKTIVGLKQPDSGIVKVGETVKIELRRPEPGVGIDPKKTVWEVVSRTSSTTSRSARTRSHRGPTSRHSDSRVLTSRNRRACCPAVNATGLNLALTLKEGGNLILLDEPTNDLDVETLSSLENALEEFPRLRGGDFARPLVPRPHLHAHSRVGGRRRQRGQMVLVRGQLRGL